MGKIVKRSSSNIALVKYWGKKDIQIPMNPSISMTLKNAYTEMSLSYKKIENSDQIELEFLFEDEANSLFADRILKFLQTIKIHVPCLNGLALKIESTNSFPHSSGIASSASSMSALALCIVALEKELTGNITGFNNELEKASFLARLGSGSAARSIYKGYTLWGKTKYLENSSDEFAVAINHKVHEVFREYGDAILIVSKKTKKVSSSVGHSLMNNHPYAVTKFNEANKNIQRLFDILASGNQMEFCELVEHEALALHAMMLTSQPSFILIEANTIALINEIKNFRESTNIPVCFTLDAGANVHLLYPYVNRPQVIDWVKNKLVEFCENNTWIDDQIELS